MHTFSLPGFPESGILGAYMLASIVCGKTSVQFTKRDTQLLLYATIAASVLAIADAAYVYEKTVATNGFDVAVPASVFRLICLSIALLVTHLAGPVALWTLLALRRTAWISLCGMGRFIDFLVRGFGKVLHSFLKVEEMDLNEHPPHLHDQILAKFMNERDPRTRTRTEPAE